MQKIAIVDYGAGNLWSIASAINYLGYKTIVTSNAEEISTADQLILPGVGSYKRAMESLSKKSLDQAIIEYALLKKRKILGICLGMQLIGSVSCEDGFSNGLGLINFEVEKMFSTDLFDIKNPHIGFNQVTAPKESILFRGVSENSDFYFTHSYMVKSPIKEAICGVCKYGDKFIASYEIENIYGTQFHPEKSQTNGLKLLSNFLKI